MVSDLLLCVQTHAREKSQKMQPQCQFDSVSINVRACQRVHTGRGAVPQELAAAASAGRARGDTERADSMPPHLCSPRTRLFLR